MECRVIRVVFPFLFLSLSVTFPDLANISRQQPEDVLKICVKVRTRFKFQHLEHLADQSLAYVI